MEIFLDLWSKQFSFASEISYCLKLPREINWIICGNGFDPIILWAYIFCRLNEKYTVSSKSDTIYDPKNVLKILNKIE